jgi:hypothetical protein
VQPLIGKPLDEKRRIEIMKKSILGLIVGLVLGLLDGLSALFIPEAKEMLVVIIHYLN